MKPRICPWAEHPVLEVYHNNEWGVPVHDDRKHFEFLVLDAFQAGLSWLTILRKRENFRKAFSGFDFYRVAEYDEEKIEALMKNEGIVRNRLKIRATVGNARAFIAVVKEFGSFDTYIWGFVGGKPVINEWKSMTEIPSSSPESDRMSKDLKKRGFRFVGSTICYAYMQAAGLVNDHEVDCYRYKEVYR